MEIQSTKVPKKVVVVGGGPAGLNLAWVAARRGHEVHLFDRNPSLGGQLIIGSTAGYKKEIRNLLRFHNKRAEKYGVQCHLGQEATVETVKQMNPDVVLVATGSVPLELPFDVKNEEMLVPMEVVLNGHALVKKRSVVVGGGATGCEIALHMAETGSKVTLIEMLPKLGQDLEAITKKVLIQRLKAHHVEILTETRVSRVEDNGVRLRNCDDTERFVAAERVVPAIGFRPDHSLYNKIKSMGYEVYQIGDCVKPRNAKEAILEGAVLGRTI